MGRVITSYSIHYTKLYELAAESREADIDLLEIPAQRLPTATIGLQANLEEARMALDRQGVEGLVVKRRTAAGVDRVYGVLTPDMVEGAYRP